MFCLCSIESLHNTEIKTIAFDFGNTSGYDKIEKVLSEMNIGILGIVTMFLHITLKTNLQIKIQFSVNTSLACSLSQS